MQRHGKQRLPLNDKGKAAKEKDTNTLKQCCFTDSQIGFSTEMNGQLKPHKLLFFLFVFLFFFFLGLLLAE